jgi:ceramide glucosyltransferase
MVSHVLALLVCLGLVLVMILHLSQRRLLGSARPEVRGELPAVSILKPLKGIDPSLEQNLRSFFVLDHPQYELIFGVSDPLDPALALARKVAAEHPDVPVRFVAGGRVVGHNPKVNNLAGMLAVAGSEIVLISDSNVLAPPDHLNDLLAHLEQPGVGLVSALIRGAGERGLGGALERLQLNTFVMGGVAAASDLAGQVCTVGKSMMLRRQDLERIGGLGELSRYLAEDQVCGLEIKSLGLDVVVAGSCVTNVLGRLRVRDFVARHLRWARIRRRMAPTAYLCELLANPVLPAVAQVALDPGTRSLAQLGATLLAMALVALSAERHLGVRRPVILYPALELLRGLLIGAAWIVPFLSSNVAWRGNRFRIGPRTLLIPADEEPELLEWQEAASEEAAA